MPLLDDLLARLDIDVLRLEVLLKVHADLLLREIPHMPHRGLHDVILAEDLVDGLGLRGRFDNDEVFHEI